MPDDSKSKRRGRPKGTPNRNPHTVAAEAVRCRQCGSTDREPYYRTHSTPAAGLDPAGRPYDRLVRRWTSCSACGQHRIERTYELTKAGQAARARHTAEADQAEVQAKHDAAEAALDHAAKAAEAAEAAATEYAKATADLTVETREAAGPTAETRETGSASDAHA